MWQMTNERRFALILWDALGKRNRCVFAGVMVANVFSAVFEVFSIGVVVPFVTILMAPEKLYSNELVRGTANWFGIDTAEDLKAPVTVIFVGVTFAAMLVRIISIRLNAKYAFSLGSELSLRVYESILSRQYAEYKRINSSEDLTKLIPKVNTLVQSLIFPFVMLASAIVMFAVITLVFLIVDFKMALSVLIGLVAIYAGVTAFFKKKLRENSLQLSRLQNGQVRVAQESIGGIKDVILGDSRRFFIDVYRKVDVELRKRQASNIVIAQAPRYLVETLSIVFIVLLAFYSVHVSHVISRDLVLPVFVTIAVGLQRILPIAQQAYRSWANIEGNKQSLYDVLGLVGPPERKSNVQDSSSEPIKFDGRIELLHISYSHRQDSSYDVNDVSLTIQSGEKVGFIGGTGSGKSTLVDIIMGLLPPGHGSLLIDGKELNGSNAASWYRHISHVPQHVYILDSDFYTNIAFSDTSRTLDKARAEWAAKQACADEFIRQRELGYSGGVGERGSQMSGGQIQRLGVARCLYKFSSLIVLDEATSALDADTERTLMENIYQLDQTVLIIAHRLSSLRGCDRIVELESGRIKRIGTYDEVIGNNNDNAFPADIAKKS
jgi:ABC-type bacteriocin/lantibiotic exporter with double-glycine peptidase domain